MRGKDEFDMDEVDDARITPAYAGKSDRDFVAVHKFIGSPPPMRGKAAAGVQHQAGQGITPAYAGKRNVRQKPKCCSRDHPRLCGEKLS